MRSCLATGPADMDRVLSLDQRTVVCSVPATYRACSRESSALAIRRFTQIIPPASLGGEYQSNLRAHVRISP